MFARVPFVSVIVLAAVAVVSLVGAAPAEAQVKVAVIDIQKVLAESASGKAAQTEIEGL
jgi:Skp family chaperone for outer membrane proteins